MERAELAARLAETGHSAQREALLGDHSELADIRLGYELKDICYNARTSEPWRAKGAAAALRALSDAAADDELVALAAWVDGMVAVHIDGQMERAISHLDDAEARFLALGQPHTAASTQVSKLYALALLGRYDEAIACGLRARQVFLTHHDTLAAGKIEHNIGNIYWRRDLYNEAEVYLSSARLRFLAAEDNKQLAMIENCLAYIQSLKYNFRRAEELYRQALERAEAAGLVLTQAEIEASMGNFALFQGRYDRALDYLERSRRKFASLGMAHQSAVAEQEIADAYLELNLAPEAAAIYERIIPVLAESGMRAEQARALLAHGRASILLNQMNRAHVLLAGARELYAAEGNAVGEAVVTLVEAQLHHAEGSPGAASAAAAQSEGPLESAGAWRQLMLARWLRAEAARAQGQRREARVLLESTLRGAVEQALPQVAERCHTSLGLLAASEGDLTAAEESFKRAVELIEEMRAPLPAEEFRTAFFSNKLVPYDELVRLCIGGDGARVEEAFRFVERARSRALVDRLGGSLKPRRIAGDPFEAKLHARLEELRTELNWFYSRINRPGGGGGARHGAEAMAQLHEALRRSEGETLDIMRQLQHHGEDSPNQVEQIDVGRLRVDLGTETALVEYTSLDGQLLAFVVTDEGVRLVRELGREEEVSAALTQVRFQVDALRYGSERMRRHLPLLTERVRHHLGALYDLLLAPVEGLIGGRRLVVVPHRTLHYVPFHALHDGRGYVIQRREVCYAPSAVVLRHCLARPHTEWRRALIVGVPDEEIPHVREEVSTLAPLFPEAVALMDERATLEAVRAEAPHADVVHLACHGQFRPDNPLFSSLRLADGWMTVRDASSLELNCGLVTLSACETGMSAVVPGDELIGLARGFFSAGAPSLLLSLWTVSDEATARLMSRFYARLGAGERPASALRQSQCELLEEQPHPFFWSPFVLLGRW
jgi:tetratricopeptide (TPR) repeat protein